MHISLDDFVASEEARLKAFKQHWIDQNKINPEAFPMEIEEDNGGVWSEMLENFNEDYSVDPAFKL